MKFACRLVLVVLVSQSLCSCVYRSLSLSGSANPTDRSAIIQAERDLRSAESSNLGIRSLPTQTIQLPPPSLDLNPHVHSQIAYLRRGSPQFLEASLGRRLELWPTLSQIFEDEGVPHEIANVAFIESGFDNEARSSAGAVGMWQFMKSTARVYGLKVNLFQDQRKDPILSTIAAARHLRDLYTTYNDWYLALAAYNAGPGAIDRAMQKSGAADFWELAKSGRIRTETKNFVPRFIAATLIAQNPQAYGFSQYAMNPSGEDDASGENSDNKIASWAGNRRSRTG